MSEFRHGNGSASAVPPKNRHRPGRDRFTRNRAIFSALDLGTNNCRLLIARPAHDGFKIIDAFSRVVRLGEGLAQNGRLSDAAIDRAISALKVCARKIERRKVTCLRSVATEACRSADNCDDFLASVKRETGLNLDVISAGEEARLAVLGCQALLSPNKPYALVFDIGGGSTELIFVGREGSGDYKVLAWTSMPWGVVNMSEHFASGDVMPEDYAAMRQEAKAHLERFEQKHGLAGRLCESDVQLLGTSGTVTTLASLYLELPVYDRNKVDGLWIDLPAIRAVSDKLSGMTLSQRQALPCIGNDRADLVVAGCAILEAILDYWPATRLRVADRGIREGILRSLMGQGPEVRLSLGEL